MAALNPAEFINNADGMGGLAKANKFSVMITPPSQMPSRESSGIVQFLCHTAELPGKTFSTVEDRIYGIEVMKPYGATFDVVTLSFYNTNNFLPRKFWEEWMEWIQPQKSRDMRYYDDMYGSVQLYHYSEAAPEAGPGSHNYMCTLNEAWPYSIDDTEINWDNQEIMEFQVQLRFKDWNQGSSRSNSQSAGEYTARRLSDYQNTGNTSRGF